MQDTREQFSPLTVGLHWLIGLTMIGMIGFGLYIDGLHPQDAAGKAAKGYYVGIHKSIGVLVLIFASWRLLRRLRIGLPEHVGIYSALEQWGAKLTHIVLLAGTLLMPLSGLLMSIGGARPVDVFGVRVLPQLLSERNPLLSSIGGGTHAILGKLLILVIGLHIAGALKHHIIDRDGTLRRILGARVPPTRQA